MSREPAVSAARLTREQSRARTRQQLLEAAAEVFSERGFYGASVEEIAERAGYTRGAFYAHFAGKDDAFLALLDERFARGVDEVTDIIRGSSSLDDVMAQLRARAAAKGIDESWMLLHREFELYAIRNPAARPQLAARNRDERAALANVIAYEFRQAGFAPPAPKALFGLILKVLDHGCDIEHVIDPEGVPDDAYFDAVSLLFEASLALARARREEP
jgi:AcrR family transcriptional regulator